MKLIDLFYWFLSANTNRTINQSISCAKECLAHFVEIVTPEIEEVAVLFLHAAIRNPYLIDKAGTSAKDLAEWAVLQAKKWQEETEKGI